MQTRPVTAPIQPITLSDEQIAAYHRDGFVRLGRILDPAGLEAVRADEARMRAALPSGDAASTHFWSLVMRTCPGARELATRGAQIAAAARIIGPDVALWWNQFVTKMPDGDAVRGEFPWHQDNGYADVLPGTNVTVWSALDDVDERNGCVWVVPGSHRRGLLPHATPSATSWHLQVPVEGDGVPVPMAAGEAVLFSGYTLHRSKHNRSAHPRRAFFMQYADAAATLPTRKGVAVVDHPDAWMVAGWAPRPVTSEPAG